MKKIIALFCICCCYNLFAQNSINHPLPSNTQLVWHDMEFYLFVHFGPNTFTNKEWGLGNEPEDVFNPTQLNCSQWCNIAKAAGARGIIITAKHHDGFCLWPSKFSTHTVKESKWRNGKGDVLKELSEACKQNGLKFGVYISPWDRNHPQYGTAAYNDVFVGMLKELFQRYGPIYELWWDGANGEGPNGKKQVYDWDRFKRTVAELSPNTLVFSDIGPHIRWTGNEKGIAGFTNWNLLDTAGFTPGAGAPSADTLNTGNIYGKNWIPAECDVSIRKGWFYHNDEDATVKTPQQLFGLYLKSVGRGANLLLNVPPNDKGLISAADSASLVEFKKLKESCFKTNLLKQAMIINKVHTNKTDFKREVGIHLQLKKPVLINCLVLRENIRNGQLIKKMNILVINNGEVVHTIPITTVGHKRIITFTRTEATEIALVITNAKGKPELSDTEGYLIKENLVENEK